MAISTYCTLVYYEYMRGSRVVVYRRLAFALGLDVWDGSRRWDPGELLWDNSELI